MGLSTLTEKEEATLLLWVEAWEKRAKESVPVLTCGRPGETFVEAKPESYQNVRVNISASGNSNEIISGVRQRLRTMNGTEVVYTSDEADLTISLVAIETKAKGSDYKTGSAISVAVTKPCVWKLGTNLNNVYDLQYQFVQVGTDIQATLDSIVSTVDSETIESQRKLNASYRKLLVDYQKQ